MLKKTEFSKVVAQFCMWSSNRLINAMNSWDFFGRMPVRIKAAFIVAYDRAKDIEVEK